MRVPMALDKHLVQLVVQAVPFVHALPRLPRRESLTNLKKLGQIVKLKPPRRPPNIKLHTSYENRSVSINIRGALMTWIIRQILFRQNVEIENLLNFNDVKISRYTVTGKS